MRTDPLLKYQALAKQHNEPNDGSRAWVRRTNRAARSMRKIAKELLAGPKAEVEAFAALLDVQEERTRLWAAHHLLEFVPSLDSEIATKALSIIEKHADSDSIDAPGERLWLQEWRKRASGRSPRNTL